MKIRFREGWSSLLFLLGMLMAVAWSLEAAQWVEGIHLVQWAVILGLLLGVLSSHSKLPNWFSHTSAGLHGIFWMAFLTGSLLPARLTWHERIEGLRSRYWVWLGKAVEGNTNTDNTIFLMECLLVLFLISYAAAWCAYRRHSTWQVILPAGVVLVLNIYNAQGEHGLFLFIYLICALLFAVRAHLADQENWWQAARVGYSRMASLDFLRDGAIFSILVILLAQALPAAAANPQVEEAIHTLEGPWQSVRDRWGQLFATLNYKPEPTGTGFFGSSLMLGGPLQLNNTPMMEGRMLNARYWMAVTYDKYSGRGWENGDTLSVAMRSPDNRLGDVGYAALEPVTQTIKVFYPTSQLFGAPQPIAWNKPIVAQMNRDPKTLVNDTPAGTVPPLMISMANSAVPVRANDEYTVLSLVSKADIRSLRKAGTDYPAWVKNRYLQLPTNMPPRIRLLADRVTRLANAENNYDKASAIEAYVRQFTYNEYIQAPPAERDVVDYFLFTSRQGYCNYYASAMAVMLRLLDIPARIVSGYSRGDYDAEQGVYRIRESDSHTWVEVFFPKYGWIQFEPTASQPLIERLETSAESDNTTGEDPSAGNESRSPRIFDKDELLDELEAMRAGEGGALPLPEIMVPIGGVGYVGILGLLVAIGALVFLIIGWRRHLATLTPLEAEYESMQRYAQWMGMAPRAAQTPHEFAAYLAARIPEAAAQLLRLAELYVRALFARGGLNKEEESEAKALWPLLRRNFFTHFLNQTLITLLRAPERIAAKRETTRK